MPEAFSKQHRPKRKRKLHARVKKKRGAQLDNI